MFDEELITKIFAGSDTEIGEYFAKWNRANAITTQFSMAQSARNQLGDKFAELIDNPELTAILLETIRILSRDRDGLEGLLNKTLCDKILVFAAITAKSGYPKNVQTLMEAQKCLVNTMFHSQRMRDRFYANYDNNEKLHFLLGEFEESHRKVSKYEWIRQFTPEQSAEIWYFYHRIAFIATAMSRDLQRKWADEPVIIDRLLCAVEILIGKTTVKQQDLLRATEALKTFFNVFCHFHGDVKAIDEVNAAKASRILRDVICSDTIPDDVIQSAIHALSVPPLPVVLSVLCSDPSKDTGGATSSSSEVEESDELLLIRDYDNMTFTEALLMALDKELQKAVAVLKTANPNELPPAEATRLTDLIGPYFQALARMCVESKHVRRYCRIRVLPPLMADEVKKRPEEHDSLRGRIVRVMMLPSATKDVAAEFLFIICKRSVNRMIKYVGFGHSAGHLANLGLLGQINQPKHASDSEDSETEDYNQVRDSVNPVTGAMYPPDHGSALAGMSDEQKEFEAMKLVDAMNKMMDAGIVKPGTIGEDGKVREVKHVLELLENAPDVPEKEDSDSD